MSEVASVETIISSGKQVDHVDLEIDYQIIEHFSRHLYGSPNKAVEELVSNGFDAFATKVYVYIPGRFTSEYVLVWDNGTAMDIAGFKQLWWIARSPKDHGDRIESAPGVGARKMIGKFGIGKLASYAVGNKMTHLCRRGSRFLLVGVDYNKLHEEGKKLEIATDGLSIRNTHTTPIIELTEEQALDYVSQLFNSGTAPQAIDTMFESDTWTLAIVSDLKKVLQEGRLTWVLGMGMPLRPDFNVYINDILLEPKLLSDAKTEWTFDAPEVRQSLEAYWRDGKKRGELTGELHFGSDKGLDPAQPEANIPYVDLPNLGRVWGRIRLFTNSLLSGKASENGRSHGFFVLVRGRLLNQDDDKLLLGEPSFGTFYRAQFILNVDALDDDLLADRERLSGDTPRTREMSYLQKALHAAARGGIEKQDAEASEAQSSVSLLPIDSREHYREPLSALLMKAESTSESIFDISKPLINRVPVGDDKPIAVLSVEDNAFAVNTSHPYYVALKKRFGDSKKAQEFFRAYDMFSISERLLEGYLYDVGIPEDKVRAILEWRDGLFREFADSYEKAPTDLAMDLINKSYLPGKPFEDALANLLNDMGFNCERDGASGKKDVILVAEIGPEKYRFTFESKGSKNTLPNDGAEVGGAVRHRDDAGAEHAVIVARKFAGFDKGGDGSVEGVAILGECAATGGVSIMTVEALVELHKAMHKFGFTLDTIKDIFRTVESPKRKLERIRDLQRPPEDFNYRLMLEALWEHQGGESVSGDYVAYRTVWQTHFRKQHHMSFDDFEKKLIALEGLSGGRIRLLTERELVYLKQAPQIIAEHIERMLALETLDKDAESAGTADAAVSSSEPAKSRTKK
jgi:hypothetical protein